MKNNKPLNSEEQNAICKVQEVMGGIKSIPCTACHYCANDCPQNIAIPDIFAARNKQLVWGHIEEGKRDFANAISGTSSAPDCINCGQCESACPQQLRVMEHLKRCAEVFDA